MTFQEATDRLLQAGLTLSEVAAAISYESQTVRAIRSGARKPPPPEKWKPQLVALARARIDALQGFVTDAEE